MYNKLSKEEREILKKEMRDKKERIQNNFTRVVQDSCRKELYHLF